MTIVRLKDSKTNGWFGAIRQHFGNRQHLATVSASNYGHMLLRDTFVIHQLELEVDTTNSSGSPWRSRESLLA